MRSTFSGRTTPLALLQGRRETLTAEYFYGWDELRQILEIHGHMFRFQPMEIQTIHISATGRPRKLRPGGVGARLNGERRPARPHRTQSSGAGAPVPTSR